MTSQKSQGLTNVRCSTAGSSQNLTVLKQPQKRGGEGYTNPCNSHSWQQHETGRVMRHLHPNLFINKVTTYSKLLQAFTNLSITVSSLT